MEFIDKQMIDLLKVKIAESKTRDGHYARILKLLYGDLVLKKVLNEIGI